MLCPSQLLVAKLFGQKKKVNRVLCSEMKNSPGSYAAAGTPVEVKEYRAKLALELKRAGVSLDVIVKANNLTQFPVGRSTLFAHVKALEAGEAPLSAEKHSGRPVKLTTEEWAIVAGAILLEVKKTDLQWVVTWIEGSFGVNVSLATVSRWLDELELSFRLISGRPMPKSMTEEDYVIQYYDFVQKLHNESFFDWDHKKIVCVDCCTNSRRLERETTIAMVRSKQKKFSANRPLYTNTYVVAVCLDDEGQYPALMFTHDPAFDPAGPRVEEVQKWFDEWQIDRDRVIYTKGAKKYNYESADMLAHFKNVYCQELKGTRIMHDGGNSFKIGGEFMLADGADRHVVLPAATHGELSPLDNKVNAIAKNWWRTERSGDDFSKQDLHLLWCFDWVEPKAVRICWEQNFMLKVKKLSLAATKDQLQGKKFSRGDKMASYIAAFESWREEQGVPIAQAEFEVLQSNLDGSYWTE
jgi:transposase